MSLLPTNLKELHDELSTIRQLLPLAQYQYQWKIALLEKEKRDQENPNSIMPDVSQFILLHVDFFEGMIGTSKINLGSSSIHEDVCPLTKFAKEVASDESDVDEDDDVGEEELLHIYLGVCLWRDSLRGMIEALAMKVDINLMMIIKKDLMTPNRPCS